jgi:DNA-nicking Smr family endonuclease
MTKKSQPPSLNDLVPDRKLWESVSKAVKPLRGRRSRAPELASERAHSNPAPVYGPAPNRFRGVKPVAPPLTGLERRLTQKLMRGQVPYDRKLDLHGLVAGEARVQLAAFLKAARAENHRLVLVVTGKGASPFSRHTLHGDSHYHAPEREGRLRRLVSDWLHEPEFREHVSGFQPAHPKHGGGGAYYIRLRRAGRGAR